MKGLIVKEPWADMILDGVKNLELRGSNIKIRGTIGIIKSGTKMVYGTVELVDSVLIESEDEFNRLYENHRVKCNRSDISYKNLYGWVLKNPVRYETPMKYEHKPGCVVWVNID